MLSFFQSCGNGILKSLRITILFDKWRISRFNNLEAEKDRAKTDQSFFVPVEEIEKNDYDLSINKYKEVVYEKVEYEPTEVILEKIESIETEIQTELVELKKLLSK